MPFIESKDRPKPLKLERNHTSKQEADFKAYIVLGYSLEQAALAVGVHVYYAKRYLKQAARQAKNELKLELLQALRRHVQDNASAAVFAAKAKLGWQDQAKAEQSQAVEYIDLPSTETREQWQKRHAKG